MNQYKFTDQCTGKEFVERNSKLDVCETKSGRLFFIGSTDKRGYISDEAAALLEQEMAKPGASLKKAIALLSFSNIHAVDEETEEEQVIPTLHLTPQAPKMLQSWKSDDIETSNEDINSTFTNQCTGKEFVERNSKLEIKETKSGKLFFVGSFDGRGYISQKASCVLKNEMAKPGASLKKAIENLSFSIIHGLDEENGKKLVIPTLHLRTEGHNGLVNHDDEEIINDCSKNVGTQKDTAVAANESKEKSPMEVLNSLIGLASVKQDVGKLVNMIKVQKMRKDKGLKVMQPCYHCVFTGNPGTGKTTVARILAGVYHELGILEKGQLIETDRSGLVAEYVGQTAVKTNNIIDKAIGGILFIDEAYTLISKGNDFGSEAIATLLKRMEDDRDKFVVILAGYPKEMKDFIDSNPGLQSRFNRYIEFPDYTSEELMQIFDFYLKKYELVLTAEARITLAGIFDEAIEQKDENFGNGRYVRNIFDKTIEMQSDRLVRQTKPSIKQLSEITKEDIPLSINELFIVNEKGNETYRLQDLIGLNLGSNLVVRPIDVGEIIENGEKDKIVLQNFVDDEIKKYLPGLLFLRRNNYDDFFKQLTMKVEMKLGFTYSIRIGALLIGMFFVDTPLYNKKMHGIQVWTIDFFLLPMARKQGIMTIVLKRILFLLKEKMGVKSVYAMVDKNNTICIKFLENNFFERDTMIDNQNLAYLYKSNLQTIKFVNNKE